MLISQLIYMLFAGKVKSVSPLVSALLLTIIVVASFTLLYTVWQNYTSKVAETQQQKIIETLKELSWSAGIEYGYILNKLDKCILYLWYYCAPINCSLVALYVDNSQLIVSFDNISSSIINSLYLYNLTINLATCPTQSSVTVKLVVAFSKPGSPYYMTREVTHLVPVIAG